MNDGLLGMLGLCRRAGRLMAGTEKTKAALKGKKAFLVIIGSDISEKTEKEMRFFSAGSAQVLRLNKSTAELAKALGVNAGVFAVTDKNFAEQIKLKGGTL